jgi:hypothetical protein
MGNIDPSIKRILEHPSSLCCYQCPAPPPITPPCSTTRDIHFYEENFNDESKTVIEERFL